MKNKVFLLGLIFSMLLYTIPAAASPRLTAAIKPQFDNVVPFSEGLAGVEKNGKWGFIDKSGKLVINYQFDEVDGDGFNEGLAAVKQGDKWGFINRAGKFEIKPQFEGIALPFSGGFAGIDIDYSSWATIDRTGKIIAEGGVWNRPFKDDRILMYENGKFGFKDREDKIVIKPVYDYVNDFSEGLAAVRRDNLWGFVDIDGNEEIPLKYTSVNDFQSGKALVKKSTGEWTVIDTKGNELVNMGNSFNSLQNFEAGVAVFETGYKYGLVDEAGKILVDPYYDYIRKLEDYLPDDINEAVREKCKGLFRVKLGSDYGVIDKTGKFIVKPETGVEFDYMEDTYLLIEKSSKSTPETFGVVEFSGKQIAAPVYTGIGSGFNDNLIAVQKGASVSGYDINGVKQLKNGKWGYIDVSGKTVVNFIYDGASDFSEGVAAVYDKNGVKLIDKTGKIIVNKPQYVEAKGFERGIAAVKDKKGKWGYIDKTGKEVVKPQYLYEGKRDDNGYIRVATGTNDYNCKYGVIDTKGKVIYKFDNVNFIDFNEKELIKIKKNNKVGLVDKNYKELVKPIYDEIGYFVKDGMIEFVQNGKYGFLSCTGAK